MKPAIFLDRDGTITEDRGYIKDPKNLVLINNAAKALKLLKAAGFWLIIVSNQSGVGRGYLTLSTLEKIHKKLREMLSRKGADIDGVYFCPHLPDNDCRCRKPGTGMAEKAMRDFDIDIKKSWVIGDKGSDIEFGKRLGAKTILVLTGYGMKEKETVAPDFIVDNILDAAVLIKKSTQTR
jgi:histidinol-phosphate phosphatase family protein